MTTAGSMPPALLRALHVFNHELMLRILQSKEKPDQAALFRRHRGLGVRQAAHGPRPFCVAQNSRAGSAADRGRGIDTLIDRNRSGEDADPALVEKSGLSEKSWWKAKKSVDSMSYYAYKARELNDFARLAPRRSPPSLRELARRKRASGASHPNQRERRRGIIPCHPQDCRCGQ